MVSKELKKQLFLGRMILSLIVSLLLFLGVFSFGYFIAFENYKSIATEQDKIYNSLISLQLEKELIQTSCENFDLSEFSKDLNNMGDFMGKIEEQLGRNNPEVIEQKKVFTMLQIQHYLLVKERNKNCEEQYPIILFFYSNQNEYIDQAEVSGYILSTFRKINKSVMLYSLDYNLDSNLIRSLKRVKGITQPNSVVIGETILTDLKNINELDEAFNTKITPSLSPNIINLN